MQRFPSVVQYKNVIANVKRYNDHNNKNDMPTLNFVGTVKLHGTNASVVQESIDAEFKFQSRQYEITPENDNYGFARFATDINWKPIFLVARKAANAEDNDLIVIYGEWCGKGINAGTAIANLEKTFFIFNIKKVSGESEYWLSPSEMVALKFDLPERIYSIYDERFKTFSVSIDFNNPQLKQNFLIEQTLSVEEECPVAKHFGYSGVGEGIVWRCNDGGRYAEEEYWFKVKGEKHSVSKVKTLAEVDTEKLNSINEFADYVVTEQRLLQGVEYLKEMNLDISVENTATFLRWMVSDIKKEEEDTILKSGLDEKDLMRKVALVARTWYLKMTKT